MIYSMSDGGHSMRVALLALTVATAVLLAVPTDARDSQPCIPKATQALPHVSGLVIKQTRTRAVSTAVLSTWQGNRGLSSLTSTSSPTGCRKLIHSCA